MGLAPYGDPERFRPVFEKLARVDADHGTVTIDWPTHGLADAEQGYPHARAFLAEVSFTPRTPDGDIHRDEADFAAALQERLTTLLVELTSVWLERTGERNLCLAGGTFLNCKSNQSIAALPGVDAMFVQPASGDDGTALGAAWHVARGEGGGLAPVTGAFDPYLGPRYDPDEVRAALEARPDLRWTHVGEIAQYYADAAADIAADRIVAWFSGRMEFGPRALGNRSILARPDGDRIKERINGAVKFREAFRPFAPAVLDEDVDRLFVTRGFEPDRYMLCTAQVRPEARHRGRGHRARRRLGADPDRARRPRPRLRPAAARGQGPHRGRRRRQHVVQRQGPAADHGPRHRPRHLRRHRARPPLHRGVRRRGHARTV